MSDPSVEVRRSYRRHVSREILPYGKGLCAIPECPEEERGMWTQLMHGALSTLRYLAPATLLAIFWGHTNFLVNVLRHIETVFRSIIYSSDKQSAIVLRWVSDNSPVHVSCLEEVWRHGWLLCGLLERSLPGACGGHPRAEVSIEHAQNLAEEYLGVQPVFSQEELESRESLSKRQEWRLTHYLEQVRKALSRLGPTVSKPNTPRCPIQEAQAYTLDYVARGMGLCYVQTNQKMCFKIYPTAQQCLEPGDIKVLIRGPKDTFGTAHVPPIYGRAQLIRQAFLGLNLKSQYTQGSLPLTQGATYLRTYGKNDMNKTFYIPKNKEDIDIEVSVRRDQTKVTYTARHDGVYEISLTSRGYNLIGSPFRVVSSEASIECDTSTELNDDEECEIVDVKSDRRVVVRIVDFVTEKMLLNDNGSLEKITEEEANKLISNTKRIHKVDKNEPKVLNQLDLIEQDLRKNYCARTRFKAAAKSIIKLIEVCKEFKATIKKKVTIDPKYEDNFTSHSDIPDIVHSMIFDKNMHAYWNIEETESITIETSKTDLIETKSNANEITKSSKIETQDNYLERSEHTESDNEYTDQHYQSISDSKDHITGKQDKPILTTQKPIKISVSPQNNIEGSPLIKFCTVTKGCQKETESEVILVNPFMCNITEIHENIFETKSKKRLESEPQSNMLKDFQGTVLNEVCQTLGNTANKNVPTSHEAAQSLEISISSNQFEVENAIALDDISLEYLAKIDDDIYSELTIEKTILPTCTLFHNEREKNYSFINAGDTFSKNFTKINNETIKYFPDESFETENMKSQGNSITFNPFYNKSFDVEREPASPRERDLENSIQIIVQMEDSKGNKFFTNPFVDTQELERPKTPILKIIRGDKDRDSVYVDSNLKPPDNLSTDEEIWKSNEFLNPLYVKKIYQNTKEAILHTPPLMTDFLIGAPVSLPHFLKAQSPEPNMDSIIMASTLEEALNKYDMKLQNMKQSKSTEGESIFSTPVPPNPTHIIKEAPLEDICKDDNSPFYSSEYYVTEPTTVCTDCTNDSIQIPHRELWDSAYVSIDEPSGSPDSNNNSENGYKFKILEHEKFTIPKSDLFNMGPAEREIWQTFVHENSDRVDLQEQVKCPKIEQKRSFRTILESDEKVTSTTPKDLDIVLEKKNQSDSITEVLTELNDIYNEYAATSEKASFELEPDKEKFESLEVNFSILENDNNVDSASELISDVKRHKQTTEAVMISEVQSIATESFSASRSALEESLIRKIENPSVTNGIQIFGEMRSGNLVHERKKYWDEKIKEIEEMKQQQQWKRKKHLKLNDSLGKRKGKNIAKNFINSVELINSNNVRATHDNVVNNFEHVEPTNEPQTEVKIVDKWKKFWDDKLVTTENVNLFPIPKNKIIPTKKPMSPVMLTIPNVAAKNLTIQKDSGETSPEETLPQPEIHSPIKFDVSDEKVFKAFETSPKRFFGNSRRNILEKIDAFIGHQTFENNKLVNVPNISSVPKIGIVSSRISMFNMHTAHEDNVHKHVESMGTDRQNRHFISETYINQTSIDDCDDKIISITDIDYEKLETHQKEPESKKAEKIIDETYKFRKSTSKSEMDLFNKTQTTSDDFSTHKSCEELNKVNVRNFISLFEHQAEQKVQSNSEPTADISSSHKDVPNVPQNAESCKVLPEQPIVNITPEEIDHGSVIYEAIQVSDRSTPSTQHIIEEPIAQTDDKEHISETKQPDATEYKQRFKMAKQFFKSLEEINGDDGEKMQKLNECEMLLYSQSASPNSPKLRKKKNTNRAYSAPTSDCEYESNLLTDSWDGYGSGAGGRKLIKISEKFQVEDLFKDVAGDGSLTRKGSFRGIPHRQAVLATFKSMENIVDAQLSSYEMSRSQLSDFSKDNKVKNAQTHLTEYPYLPETNPSKYRSRLDNKASGLISRKELLKETLRPRRNSVPDALRLNEKFTVHM